MTEKTFKVGEVVIFQMGYCADPKKMVVEGYDDNGWSKLIVMRPFCFWDRFKFTKRWAKAEYPRKEAIDMLRGFPAGTCGKLGYIDFNY